MTPEGIDFYSGNVPGGIWLLIGLISVTWFVLWFVYRFSGIFRLSRLWLVGTSFTLFWLAGYAFFWYKFPPPLERQRVLIYPNVDPYNGDSFLDLYIRGIHLHEYLRIKTNPNNFLIYHPDWHLKVADWDSLTVQSYQKKLFGFMQADHVLLLRSNGSHESIVADLIQISESENHIYSEIARVGDDKTIHLVPRFFEAFSIEPGDSVIYTSKWPDEIQEFWGDARLARIRGDLNQAVKGFENALRLNKDFHPALIELAQIEIDSALFAQNQGGAAKIHMAETAQLLERLRDLEITSPIVSRLWGEYALLSSNFVMAEMRLKESHYLDRDDDRLYLDLARLHPSRYYTLKFLNEEALLRRAIFVNPASIQARIQYSDYLHLLQRRDESEQVLLDMLELFPKQYDLQLTLGSLYITHGKYSRAVDLFTNMLSRSYHDKADIKFNLGVAYFNDGRIEDAYKILSELEGVNPDVYLYLAYIHEERGEINKAIEYLRERIRQSRGPDDRFKEEARKHLVTLLNRQESVEE